MGGRGASSGVSRYGSRYGTQYRAIYTSGNIKYVRKNERTSESLMETMTRGRVYAVVGGDVVTAIVYFDDSNKRMKQMTGSALFERPRFKSGRLRQPPSGGFFFLEEP